VFFDMGNTSMATVVDNSEERGQLGYGDNY
jgi:hypothetical protein